MKTEAKRATEGLVLQYGVIVAVFLWIGFFGRG